MKPLAIDLFCGLGGWASGLMAEGFDVIGFDIERHVYGEHRYPAQLVLQDVLTLHGSQFKGAALIVASPPCQFFSYTAMPWSIAKKLATDVRACPIRTAKKLALFNACFRIQREACEAAGRHIPLVVENVRGAIPWVGRSRWNFGSFHLWGDVPALMPITLRGAVMKHGIAHRSNGATNFHGSDPTKRGQDFTRVAGRQTTAALRSELALGDGIKQGGTWWHDPQSHQQLQIASTQDGQRPDRQDPRTALPTHRALLSPSAPAPRNALRGVGGIFRV